METVLLVIHLMLALALVAIILVQRTSTDGLGGIGGGSSNANFLSGRASANLLTRTTAILAALFMLNSLVLGVLAGHHFQPSSLLDQITTEQPSSAAPATSGPQSTDSKENPQASKPAKSSEPSVPMAE